MSTRLLANWLQCCSLPAFNSMFNFSIQYFSEPVLGLLFHPLNSFGYCEIGRETLILNWLWLTHHIFFWHDLSAIANCISSFFSYPAKYKGSGSQGLLSTVFSIFQDAFSKMKSYFMPQWNVCFRKPNKQEMYFKLSAAVADTFFLFPESVPRITAISEELCLKDPGRANAISFRNLYTNKPPSVKTINITTQCPQRSR